MKKIIVAFLLIIGFSINANAQESKKINNQQKESSTVKATEVDFNDLAKKETHSVVKLLQLDQQMSKDLNNLFLYKHKQMSLAKDDKEKQIISEQIEAKLRAGFTPEQMAKIISKPDLLDSLIH